MTKDSPTVSYVVTLYNKAPYVPYMLAGLSAQRGDFDKQFVFVDDGSTDDTVAQLQRLTEGWGNVVITQQTNSGPAVAMNKGFSLATGDLIKPVDGDDMLLPWATDYLLRALRETKADVAYTNMKMQGKYNLSTTPSDSLRSITESAMAASVEADFLKKAIKNAQTNPTAWLASRQLVRALKGSDEGVFVQDYSLELKLAATAKFVRLDNCLFLAPADAPGRLSDDGAQTLHDLNLAAIRFVRSNPYLPSGVKRYIISRTAGRAWAWARRHNGKGFLSKEFATLIGAKLGLFSASPAVGEVVCAPFRNTSSIRLM